MPRGVRVQVSPGVPKICNGDVMNLSQMYHRTLANKVKNVEVSKHFLDRLVERFHVNEHDKILLVILKKFKNHQCEILFDALKGRVDFETEDSLHFNMIGKKFGMPGAFKLGMTYHFHSSKFVIKTIMKEVSRS